MFFVLSGKKMVKNILLFGIAAIVLYNGFGYYAYQLKDYVPVWAEESCYIAVVIDDFGYHGEGTEEMLALEIPFTAAIMPFSSHTAEDTAAVKQAGKEVIVHMPMESLTGKKSWVGEKGIFRDMTEQEIQDRVLEALSAVPDAVGLNNHMGSAIMEDARCLSAVTAVTAEKGLIFIDSMTTPKSQTSKVCGENGTVYLKRDVFLDSTDDIGKVKKQLEKAAEVAKRKGYAVTIGHVGPEGGKITAQAIKELAPELQKEGIEFVTVSELSKVIETGQIQTKKTAE